MTFTATDEAMTEASHNVHRKVAALAASVCAMGLLAFPVGGLVRGATATPTHGTSALWCQRAGCSAGGGSGAGSDRIWSNNYSV